MILQNTFPLFHIGSDLILSSPNNLILIYALSFELSSRWKEEIITWSSNQIMEAKYFHALNVNTKQQGKVIFKNISIQSMKARYFHAPNVDIDIQTEVVFCDT